MACYTIGIAGGSGSGKSTLVERLLDAAPGRVAHLPHDAYYRNRDEMPPAVAQARNWDHPDALDTDLYLHHIDLLKSGRPVACPVYDFAAHARRADARRIEPRPVLLLEGILLFHVPGLRERIDLKVYVETPADLRILRRMLRDVSERGRTAQSVGEQYESTVRPMHALFVEPSKAFADIVVPWELHNHRAAELIGQAIERSAECKVQSAE